jgi:methionyl-tRNA formyltransferase
MNLRIIFMGSPEFAIPILKELASNFTVQCVFTQPDRPSGRNRVLKAPPIKEVATMFGLDIFQPEKLKSPGVIEKVQNLNPDLIVVAAYGQILRPNILNLPKYGCLNVHASLLPRWRGASPIYAVILAGDKTTGATIIKMDDGIDTGAILAQESLIIEENDTLKSLSDKLSLLGAKLVIKTIPDYINGRVQLRNQEADKATYSPQLKKEDGLLNFEKPAEILERQIRACNPWPGAFFDFEGQQIKVLKAKIQAQVFLPIGKREIIGKRPMIGTCDGALEIIELQPASKKKMSGEQFLQGARSWIN